MAINNVWMAYKEVKHDLIIKVLNTDIPKSPQFLLKTNQSYY